MAGIYRLTASGTVAAADIAVTLTAGSADVDLSSATIPRNYQGYLLKVFDSSERMIQGFVYTDGAGTVQNIVSTKGGSTRNWASQAAGFDDTTNCRYELWKVNNAVSVATGSIPAGESKMDTTTANAFAAPESSGVPFDFSAFQDGRHIYWAQDSSGYVAYAWISASAPGGETLDVEKITNGDCELDANWGAYGSLTTRERSNVQAHGGTYSQHVLQNTAYTGLSYTGGVLGTNAGEVYKTVYWLYPTVGTGFDNLILSGNPLYSGMTLNTWASKTHYITRGANATWVLRGTVSNQNFYTDDVSVKRLIDCAATGALLLSTQGGSRGYTYKHASFDANKALTYRIYYVGAP